ncbi:hypothetical protein F4801DRAFT_548549 [Xylaria longipes]|nr:hypothetical protein F4801DRAFT_548549 [Xylaria longipes]
MIACPRSCVVDQTVSVRVGRVVLSFSLWLLFIRDDDGIVLFVTIIFWRLELLVQVAAGVVFWLPRRVEPMTAISMRAAAKPAVAVAVRLSPAPCWESPRYMTAGAKIYWVRSGFPKYLSRYLGTP